VAVNGYKKNKFFDYILSFLTLVLYVRQQSLLVAIMFVVIYVVFVLFANVPTAEFTFMDFSRTTSTYHAAFFHATDTFNNPYQDSKFCSARNAVCEDVNTCQRCKCPLDDTLLSLDRGCFNKYDLMRITKS